MWEARATNIQMDEGDYGVALPFTVKGVTLTALDCLRFLFMDGPSGEVIVQKDFSNIQQNKVNFAFTESESALFKAGSYFYDVEWYQDGSFQCKLVQNGIFRVVT